MNGKHCLLTIVLLVLWPSIFFAQNTTSSTASSLARSSMTAAAAAETTGSPDPNTETLVRNRARVFKNRITADGTRYFYVGDSDLRGKTPDQVLQSLSPSAITAGAGVRQIDIVVNLNTPLTMFTKPDQPIYIGTAQVQGAGVHSIIVNAIISMDGLNVISK